VNNRKDLWGKILKSRITSYDLCIDIDSPDFKSLKYAREDTAVLYERLIKDKNNMPSIRFTGCGFHIILKNFWVKKSVCFNSVDMRRMFKKVEKLKDEYSELVDTSIIETRRLIKTPNTLVYKEGYDKILICKELTIKQLNEFKLEDYVYEKV
jgi:hypothetical protein